MRKKNGFMEGEIVGTITNLVTNTGTKQKVKTNPLGEKGKSF